MTGFLPKLSRLALAAVLAFSMPVMPVMAQQQPVTTLQDLGIDRTVTDPLAETVVAGLSQHRVSITASFDGSEILIFGAVKREAPAPERQELGVIITVAGPDRPVLLRRKERVAGVWINTDSFLMDKAPSFYHVATSAPLARILKTGDNAVNRVSVNHMIQAYDGAPEALAPDDFMAALLRIKTGANQYRLSEGTVSVRQDTLFDTRIALPANIIEGDYRVDFYLTREGRIVGNHATVIRVRKVGLERFVYNLAHERPLLHGLLALLIASLAGWGASEAFRLLRR